MEGDMKQPAKESKQVQRARKKLESIMKEQKQQITPERLTNAGKVILHYINRHSEQRKSLKSRDFKLFDSNQHPAETKSNYVNQLLSKLKRESLKNASSLKGRISQ
jgi:hypothetical protein